MTKSAYFQALSSTVRVTLFVTLSSSLLVSCGSSDTSSTPHRDSDPLVYHSKTTGTAVMIGPINSALSPQIRANFLKILCGAGDQDACETKPDLSAKSAPQPPVAQQSPAPQEEPHAPAVQVDVNKSVQAGIDSLGPQPIEQNQMQAFIPASITKVITSAVALKTLGRDFRFRTIVRWESTDDPTKIKNLSIVAEGDPQVAPQNSPDGVSRARISQIVDGLKAAGIKEISGNLNLMAMDPRLDTPVVPDGVEDSDMTACYGAFSQAFNYDWNCAALAISSSGDVHWVSSAVDFPLKESVTVGKHTSLSIIAQQDESGAVSNYLVRGTVSAKHSTGDMVPIADSKTWYGNTLLSQLRRSSIDVAGLKLHEPEWAEASQILSVLSRIPDGANGFTLRSDALSDLIKHMNKVSDNFFADTLFKAFARNGLSATDDMRANGVLQIQNNVGEWMRANRTPELVPEIHLIDGAGLSKENHVSARAYMALLSQFPNSPDFDVIWNSLPIAGIDGTLKGRMVGTRAQSFVHAKTGTMTGYYQLAGYVPVLNPDTCEPTSYVPFAILTNTSKGTRFSVYELQSRVVNQLMDAANPTVYACEAKIRPPPPPPPKKKTGARASKTTSTKASPAGKKNTSSKRKKK